MKTIHPNLRLNVLGTGRSWPGGKPISNFDLFKLHPDTADKPEPFLTELSQRVSRGFGFENRYLSRLPLSTPNSDEETSESLAKTAVQKSLLSQRSDKTPEAYILGSTTTRRYTGSQATSVLGSLGIQAPAYEIKAGCSTSLASLHFAFSLMSLGYENVLVSTAETLSKVIHPGIRETWFGLADAGAALWLEKSTSPESPAQIEVLQSLYSTDGRYVDLYTTPGDLPPTQAVLEQGGYFIAGDSSQLKELAKEKYRQMIESLFPSAESRKKIKYLVAHQVNRVLIEEVCKEMGIQAILPWSATQFGNLGGTSVLFTLAESFENKVFDPGSELLLMSVGGGLSFAAQHWRINR